jgi:hypothetical protein
VLTKSDGQKRDVSHADFAWCVIAIDWGHSPEATAARLMQESPKARENGQRYAELTARNAATAVAEREPKPTPHLKFHP